MEKKVLAGKSFGTVRDCVKYLNEEGITKENIVNIFPFEGIIIAIWYK